MNRNQFRYEYQSFDTVSSTVMAGGLSVAAAVVRMFVGVQAFVARAIVRVVRGNVTDDESRFRHDSVEVLLNALILGVFVVTCAIVAALSGVQVAFD
jgi:hypothetical protein